MKTLQLALATLTIGLPALPTRADTCHEVAGAPTPVCVATRTYSPQNINGRQQLDIYYRTDNPTARVAVVVPGGAWSGGDKADYKDLADSLTGLHDLTTVVVNYRLSGSGAQEVKHPDHANDVAAAFAWVKRNIAPYGNSGLVYLFGQSAGAHLASLIATDPSYLAGVYCSANPWKRCKLSDIRGVVAMSGIFDLNSIATAPNELGLDGVQSAALDSMYQEILGAAFGDSPEIWHDASPINHIGQGQPPFLIIYSFDDMPRFAGQAHDFSVAVDRMLRDTRPGAADPGVHLRRLERIDYSPEVWSSAFCLASGGEIAADDSCIPGESVQGDVIFTGHYAEVVAINPHEPNSYPTKLVVDFIASH
jgi:acetyl esterase/lipase